ncbi:hypothetical protein PLESTB_000955600 [Pleodorina starrii]|uniref:CNH domain-containing protein n=1 Tax=Pleodorina starrii TaxID=330485 RepID=A0A9W6FCR0_9CHLO|nr:hypothetical protein PLESTM_001143000 [Pleodorina starrii]GLC77803.1 hypothetical protein PLESTB_000955600 [Pleodorina starrii]GLC77881.1 hypothetical protein PLESTF_001067600 [Pleodorina starrii]
MSSMNRSGHRDTTGMDTDSSNLYEALRAQPVIKTLPGNQRVESLCCWDGLLLVGLQDGTVVQFSGTSGGGAWQVIRRHRSVERKAVVQMASAQLAGRPLLLTLTEDGVNLLSLPDMKLKCQPMGSRGASLFAWNEEGQLLAVAVRRRVVLYHLQGSELLDAGERAAPDLVSAMVWVSAGLLLLGTRRQYVLLNTTTGAVTDVATTGAAPRPLALLCPGGQEMLLARDSSTYFHSASDGRYSRRRHLAWSEPLMALAAAGQYAVAVTAGGLEVRSLRRAAEGHVVQRVSLAGPQRPVPPAVSEDGSVFVVATAAAATPCAAAAAATVGSAQAAIGSAQMAAAAAAGADGGAGCVIFRLVPVPLEEQARTLAEMGEYSEALALAELVEDEQAGATTEAEAGGPDDDGGAAASGDGVAAEAGAEGGCSAGAVAGAGPGWTATSRRALLEERLRLSYGHYLFKAGEYDDGMAQLALCKSATALVLLRLFPSLVPPKYQHVLPTHAAGQPLPPVPEPTGEAYIAAASQLLPYILSHRTRAINALAKGGAATTGAEAQAQRCAARHEAREDTVPSGHRVAVSESTSANGITHAVAAARTGKPGGPAASPTVTSGASAAGPAVNDVGGASEARPDGAGACADGALSSLPPPPPPQELLIILDTAIVRIMVVMPDTGALLRFVQLPNYVDLQEGEKALAESGMYAELAALYKCNGCHDKGLELLRKLSQEPGSLTQPPRGAAADLSGLPGVWAAVRYLVSLSAGDAAAITAHAGWILAADAEAGLSALLHMRPPLDPSLALSILNRHSAHYCGLYLETALQIGVALPQDYHNELLLIYLRDILAKEPLPSSRTSNRSGDELKELLLAHRPDPDQPPLLFPEDLAHALLNNPPPASGGAAARRFASAPASSIGTPAGMSRVGSRTSMQSDGVAAARRLGRTTTVETSVASAEETGASSSSDDEEQEHEVGARGPSHEPAEAPRPPESADAWRQQQQQQRPSGVRRAMPAGRSGGDASGAAAELPPRAPEPAARQGTAGGSDADRRPPQRPRRSSVSALGSFTDKPQSPLLAAGGGPAAGSPPGSGAGTGGATASAAAAAAAGPSLYQRLRDLVYTSPYIDPSYVLDKLPQGELLEIRALMLERLGSHREALQLYVHALRDLAGAEAYCDRVYAAAAGGGAGAGRGLGSLDAGVLGDPAQPGDIYLELVRALYDGPESCPSARVVAEAGGRGGGGGPAGGWLVPCGPTALSLAREGEGGGQGGARLDSDTWLALSRLLSRKRDRLDPMQVLDLLPACVAVADVLPWLEGCLRYTTESRRNLAVIRQLRRAENLVALKEAVRSRQQRLHITSERACSLCHKRLGNAAFVAYSGGLLAHLGCHNRHTNAERNAG